MKIAIASGKGGTGKTFVATNLFQTFLDAQKNIVLVDCDAEVPNSNLFFKSHENYSCEVREYRPIINTDICTYCRRCAEYCSYNAIFCIPPSKIIQLIDSSCHGCKACKFACTENAIIDSYSNIGEVRSFEYQDTTCIVEGRIKVQHSSAVPVIKESIKYAEKLNADYYIFDAPPGTSCPFIQTAVRSDLVILVAEPTPFGLSDLQQTVSTLNELDIPYAVIINKSNIGSNVLHEYLVQYNIDIVTSIPFMREIAAFYANGRLVPHEIREYFSQIMAYILEFSNNLQLK